MLFIFSGGGFFISGSITCLEIKVSNDKGSNFETKSFKSLKCSTAENSNDISLDDSCEPDANFFNVNLENLNMHLFPEEFKNFLDNSSSPNHFSILHLNIRSIKKNFENLKLFLKSINFTFSVISFSETWLDYLSITRDSLYELPNYTSNHQIRSNRKRGGVSVYIHNTPLFTTSKPDPI